MDIQIRNAHVSDYLAILELYKELDDLHIQQHPELFQVSFGNSRPKGYIQEILINDNKYLRVAINKNNQIVGFAEAFVMQSSPFPIYRERRWIHLENIAIKKGHQNKGIGSMLLQDVMLWTEKKGIDRIELMVYDFNQQASKFYLDKGFKDLTRTMYFNLNP